MKFTAELLLLLFEKTTYFKLASAVSNIFDDLCCKCRKHCSSCREIILIVEAPKTNIPFFKNLRHGCNVVCACIMMTSTAMCSHYLRSWVINLGKLIFEMLAVENAQRSKSNGAPTSLKLYGWKNMHYINEMENTSLLMCSAFLCEATHLESYVMYAVLYKFKVFKLLPRSKLQQLTFRTEIPKTVFCFKCPSSMWSEIYFLYIVIYKFKVSKVVSRLDLQHSTDLQQLTFLTEKLKRIYCYSVPILYDQYKVVIFCNG